MHGLKCSLVGILLLVSACAKPEAGIRVEYVDRPVITETSCVKAKDVPKTPGPLSGAAMPKNTETALSVAMAKVSEWTRYGNKADAILTACAK